MWKAILCFFWEPWSYDMDDPCNMTRTCARCGRRELFAYGMWHRR